MEVDIKSRCLVCPSCFSLFVDPVSLPCGHNVCSHCAHHINEAATTSRAMEQEFSDISIVSESLICPVCLKEFNIGDEKPNKELSFIMEKGVILHEKDESEEGDVVSVERGETPLSFSDCLETICRLKTDKQGMPFQEPLKNVGFDGFINPVGDAERTRI